MIRGDSENSLDNSELRRRRGGRPKLFTLANACRRHMQELRERTPPARPNTIKTYQSRCYTLMDGLGRDCLLAKLELETVRKFIKERMKAVSQRTINFDIELLSELIRTAVEREDIRPTPLLQQIAKLRFKIAEVDPDVLNDAEASHLILTANGGVENPPVYTRTAMILLIATECGMRHDEVLHIKRSNVDFHAKLIRIRNFLDIDWCTKGKDERTVGITTKLDAVLQAYLKEPSESEWLFPGVSPRKPLGVNQSGKAVRAVFKAAGLHGRRLPGMHMMRRSWATKAVAFNTPAPHLQKAAGWKNLSTAQRYIQTNDNHKREIAARFDRAREEKPSPATPVGINPADVDALVAQGLSVEAAFTFLRKQLERG